MAARKPYADIPGTTVFDADMEAADGSQGNNSENFVFKTKPIADLFPATTIML